MVLVVLVVLLFWWFWEGASALLHRLLAPLPARSTPVVVVTDSVDDLANADAEAPELSPPPAIGPNGVAN